MKVISVIVLCGLLISTGANAEAKLIAAVKEVRLKSIPIYKDSKGASKLGDVKRKDLIIPFPQLSIRSKHGLIKVQLHFVSPKRKPIIAWIKKFAVKTDKNVKVDVLTDCGQKIAGAVIVTRSSKSLGNRC